MLSSFVTLEQLILLSEPHLPSLGSLLPARNPSPRYISFSLPAFNLNNVPAIDLNNLPAFNLNNLPAFLQLLCPDMLVGLDGASVLFSHACKKHRGVGSELEFNRMEGWPHRRLGSNAVSKENQAGRKTALDSHRPFSGKELAPWNLSSGTAWRYVGLC